MTKSPPKRFAVLASGAGSNFKSILDAQNSGKLAPARIVCLFSDRPDCGAVDIATEAGLPVHSQRISDYGSREAFDGAMLEALFQYQVQGLVLAGYMRLLSPVAIDAFPGAIVNTHPSLLPAFPGLHGARQALSYGVKVSGCTVHFVDEGLDTGPIIAQASVRLSDTDTEESLQRRIQEQEHQLYPVCIQRLAAGLLTRNGRQICSTGDSLAQ